MREIKSEKVKVGNIKGKTHYYDTFGKDQLLGVIRQYESAIEIKDIQLKLLQKEIEYYSNFNHMTDKDEQDSLVDALNRVVAGLYARNECHCPNFSDKSYEELCEEGMTLLQQLKGSIIK